jgi:hypothetical protein
MSSDPNNAIGVSPSSTMAEVSSKQQQSPYHDKALEPGEIRLLSIIPTTKPSLRHVFPWIPRRYQLQLTTKRVKLEDKPRYDAVSYVWGTESAHIQVPCNDSSLLFTSSTYEMLIQLSVYTDLFWIDAICINQEDTIEKAAQIPLMRQIYAQAHCVVLWMGPTNALTEAFMLDFPRVFQLSTTWTPKRCRRGDAGWRGKEWPGNDDKFWDGYYYILGHEWFRRLWTFQEAVLARKAHIMCGYQEIDMDKFVLFHTAGYIAHEGYAPWDPRIAACVTKDLNLVHDGIITCVAIRWLRIRFQQYIVSGSGLPNVDLPILIFELRHSRVKEPVDRVWSIVGLMDAEIQKQLAPMVDYSDRGRSEYWKTYLQFAKTAFVSGQSHDLLNLPPSINRSGMHLPSWCPNLSRRPACFFLLDCKWNRRQDYGTWADDGLLRLEAEEDICAKRTAILNHPQKFISIFEPDQLLNTRGFVVDTVVEIIEDARLIGQAEHFTNNPWPRPGTRDPAQVAFFTFYDRALDLAASLVDDSNGPPIFPSQYLMCLLLDCGISDMAENGYLAAWKSLTRGSIWLESLGDEQRDAANGMITRMIRLVGHSFFATEGGRFGIANPGCKPGDKVCAFYGGEALYMLRWPGANDRSGNAEFCGAAFIPHLMEQHQRDEARLGEDEIFHIR